MVRGTISNDGERHPEVFLAELRHRATVYRQQIPQLREAVRDALRDLRAAQTAAEQLKGWVRDEQDVSRN